MPSKTLLFTACAIAIVAVLLMSRPHAGNTPGTTQVAEGTGIAAIQVNRQDSILSFNLTFHDPDGMTTPPRMQTPPTFEVVDADGKQVYQGTFAFGLGGTCQHSWRVPNDLHGDFTAQITSLASLSYPVSFPEDTIHTALTTIVS